VCICSCPNSHVHWIPLTLKSWTKSEQKRRKSSSRQYMTKKWSALQRIPRPLCPSRTAFTWYLVPTMLRRRWQATKIPAQAQATSTFRHPATKIHPVADIRHKKENDLQSHIQNFQTTRLQHQTAVIQLLSSNFWENSQIASHHWKNRKSNLSCCRCAQQYKHSTHAGSHNPPSVGYRHQNISWTKRLGPYQGRDSSWLLLPSTMGTVNSQ
jgi:hypothetical protein